MLCNTDYSDYSYWQVSNRNEMTSVTVGLHVECPLGSSK